jgi:quercetin dioxygenase-like cupin family protein
MDEGSLVINLGGNRPFRDEGKEKPMNEDARTYGLGEHEGDARWWLGVSLATIKATGKETGGRYTLVEVLEPEGEEAPLHVHHNEDEAFWVLEGDLTFEVGDEVIEASAGSFLFGPKDIPHCYTVNSGPARCCLFSHRRASRSSSTQPASPRRSAPCRPRRKDHQMRRRWSS